MRGFAADIVKYTKKQKLNSQNNDTSTKFTNFLFTFTFNLTKNLCRSKYRYFLLIQVDISNRNVSNGAPGAGKYQICRNHAFDYMGNPNNSQEKSF